MQILNRSAREAHSHSSTSAVSRRSTAAAQGPVRQWHRGLDFVPSALHQQPVLSRAPKFFSSDGRAPMFGAITISSVPSLSRSPAAAPRDDHGSVTPAPEVFRVSLNFPASDIPIQQLRLPVMVAEIFNSIDIRVHVSIPHKEQILQPPS